MSAHDYHEGLPGYDPAQILHDGCGECEDRSAHATHGITQLDHRNFVRAWQRAAEWNLGKARKISLTEAPMLNALWVVQVQLERYGLPIGTLPSDGLTRIRSAE